MVDGPTILVADDSRLALAITSELLAERGYRVIVAVDGIDALRKAYDERPDLIVLDLIMPRLNGYHACRVLKHDPQTRDIPVVIRTLRDLPSDRFWGLQTGAESYLTKGQDD